MIIDTDDYLTVQEAADLVGVSTGAVRYRALKGQYVMIHVGNTPLISKASLGVSA
jgi:hypothetical protein